MSGSLSERTPEMKSENESLVVADPVAVCARCFMDLEDVGEWHPLAFCLLFVEGIDDPAKYLADLGYVRPAGSSE